MCLNKRKKLDCISFLQETFSTKNIETRWKDELGGEILFNHGASNSRGVAIFLPQNVDFELCEKIIDNDGRLLIAKVKINSMIYIYTLCNLYAPTKDHKLD